MVRDLRAYINTLEEHQSLLRESIENKKEIIFNLEKRLKKHETPIDDEVMEGKQKVLNKLIEKKYEKISKLKDKFPYKPSRLKKPLKIAIHGERVIALPTRKKVN